MSDALPQKGPAIAVQHRFSQSEIQPNLPPPSTNRETAASPAQHPEYSWEHLTPRRRRQVLAMVNRSRGQTRTRLIAVLVALFLALLVIGVVGYFTFLAK